MPDPLLSIGAQFDFVAPGAAFIQDVLYGPSVTFLIDEASCTWSANQIQELLESHGIKAWGVLFALDAQGDVILITVKREQALWAQYLLQRAGLPLRNGLRPTSSPTPRGLASAHPARRTRFQALIEAFWDKLGL